MASPQIENGHTQIANELLEIIYRSGFNGSELSMLLLILRSTYGYKKKHHTISLSFIANGIGIHKSKAQEYLKRLINRNIIIVYEEASFSTPKKIGINKDYEQWELKGEQLPKQVTPTGTGREQLPKQVGGQLPKQVTKKEIINKDININTLVSEYHKICIDLPKVHKVTDTRKKHALARVREYGLDGMIKIFKKANESDFLSGRSGKWKASFDWIINQSNAVKVYEGNYANKQNHLFTDNTSQAISFSEIMKGG